MCHSYEEVTGKVKPGSPGQCTRGRWEDTTGLEFRQDAQTGSKEKPSPREQASSGAGCPDSGLKRGFPDLMYKALAGPCFEPDVGLETISAKGRTQPFSSAVNNAVPLVPLMVSLHIYRILFVVTQEALHVRFQAVILYTLVLCDVLQEGRFVQLSINNLSVPLSAPLSVSTQSLKQ